VLTLLLAGALLSPPSDEPAPPARGTPDASALARFAWDSLRNEPAAGAVDAYKWLFQAARGGEHAAPSEAAARKWLEAEWSTLGPPLPGEPLVVRLRPDGAVVRLNLRPFKASGGDPDALLRAFLASAREFHADPDLFVAAWRAFGGELERGRAAGIDASSFAELDRASESEGWPARHHGPAYAAARKPAYRVVTGEAAARLASGLEGTR
jgi:hypothetical protein